MQILLCNRDGLEGEAHPSKWVAGGQEVRDDQVGYVCAPEIKINTNKVWIREQIGSMTRKYCKVAKIVMGTAKAGNWCVL